MDQDAVVSEQSESGNRLIEALAATGFAVEVAFWAKPTDEGKWYLYLASPFVNERGPKEAYLHVFSLMRKMPDLWLEPLDIRVVGMEDSLAKAAIALTKPMSSAGRFAVKNPKPYHGMTRFAGSTLGGVSIDGAYIYPPRQPAA